MKCSEQWLKTWVKPTLSAQALADQLTMAGLEVGSVDQGIFDVELTPNRGDCLSVLGLAREIAVLNSIPLHHVEIPTIDPIISDTLPIRIESPEACPRYVGRIMRDLNPHAKTPDWMTQRLIECGIRPKHPVVDVLNYVMVELGQPMHAFDLDKIKGGIVVRQARPEEALVLLDGQTKTLSPDYLVIADEQNAVALAGVMGGDDSAVSDNTRHILIESALFMPIAMAGKGRSLGLHTDGQVRFERGVDPALSSLAMERATALIVDICGGKPGPGMVVMDPQYFPTKPTLALSYAEVKDLLGEVFSPDDVVAILTRLGCAVAPEGLHDALEPNWRIQPPSYRWDLTQSIDLIEEVARVGGYAQIPARLPQMKAQFLPQSETQISVTRLKRMWVDLGYQEVITYSFVDGQQQAILFPDQPTVSLLNPISPELGVMRLSLWPSLLNVLRFNQNRQQMQMKLFEVGSRYLPKSNGYEETALLSGLLCGNVLPEGWRQKSSGVDFYTVKQHLENVWALSGHHNALDFRVNTTMSCCHPGQCATIFSQGKSVGIVGRLHPGLEKSLDVVGPVYLFELTLSDWQQCDVPRYQGVSRFPEIRRDIAIVVDEAVTAGQVLDFVRKTAGETVQNIELFDVYQGKGIPPGRKSLAIGLILQHSSRTLIDQEAEEIIQTLVDGLKKELGAILRE